VVALDLLTGARLGQLYLRRGRTDRERDSPRQILASAKVRDRPASRHLLPFVRGTRIGFLGRNPVGAVSPRMYSQPSRLPTLA